MISNCDYTEKIYTENKSDCSFVFTVNLVKSHYWNQKFAGNIGFKPDYRSHLFSMAYFVTCNILLKSNPKPLDLPKLYLCKCQELLSLKCRLQSQRKSFSSNNASSWFHFGKFILFWLSRLFLFVNKNKIFFFSPSNLHTEIY